MEAPADTRQVAALWPRSQRQRPRQHAQAGDARQTGDELVHQAVAEVLEFAPTFVALGLVEDDLEWDDGNGWHGQRRRGLPGHLPGHASADDDLLEQCEVLDERRGVGIAVVGTLLQQPRQYV